MVEIQCKIEIEAPKETVWAVLWNDRTFRQWAGVIDEGTYLQGALNQGSEVQFISENNGYGVTSQVSILEPGSFVLFKHLADTKDYGLFDREKQWTGASESYALSEADGVTSLTITSLVPEELEGTFKEKLPQALAVIKSLAQNWKH